MTSTHSPSVLLLVTEQDSGGLLPSICTIGTGALKTFPGFWTKLLTGNYREYQEDVDVAVTEAVHNWESPGSPSVQVSTMVLTDLKTDRPLVQSVSAIGSKTQFDLTGWRKGSALFDNTTRLWVEKPVVGTWFPTQLPRFSNDANSGVSIDSRVKLLWVSEDDYTRLQAKVFNPATDSTNTRRVLKVDSDALKSADYISGHYYRPPLWLTSTTTNGKELIAPRQAEIDARPTTEPSLQ